MRRLLPIAALLLPLTLLAQEELPPYPRVEVTTNVGAFTLELDARRAPITVRNFIDYVESGYYEGTVFHRVINGFVAQGGGYDVEYNEKKPGEPIVNESGNGLTNRRGTIGMARTSDPHSATAQFYVNLVDNPSLDPSPTRWGYAVFGTVIEGMPVLDEIGHVATGPAGPLQRDAPQAPIIIEEMKVLED
jgi:cyclophilin family peptidyl-prolyl cis-trans isomerase